MTSEQSEKVRAFLEEVEALCRKHGLSLSHEDDQGAFIVERMSELNIRWLKGAYDDTGRS